LVACAWAAASLARPDALSGRITADGSSTVGPYTTAAAEAFQRKHSRVQITVGISGTGGGFERFCNGETDLSNASRPMKRSEVEACAAKGVKWVAFTVANDGITIVVNKKNTWASCLTVDQLHRIWEPGSKVSTWKDLNPAWPSQKLALFGPGTDSGTFDFFTEKINGKARASRSDYSASEDDNVLVQGVAGTTGGLGYFGLSYYEANQARLKAVKVDGGKGCVAPSGTTVQNGKYTPLSRPLFIYAKRSSFQRPEVRAFIGFIFNNERSIARTARFVSLTDRQLRKARYQYGRALRLK
jgi:phosphate transport system substrate-binding protein